jgi:hypothetical protein
VSRALSLLRNGERVATPATLLQGTSCSCLATGVALLHRLGSNRDPPGRGRWLIDAHRDSDEQSRISRR